MADIGRMDKMVVVEAYQSGGYDEYNYPLPATWVEFARLYGNYQPFSSKDVIQAQAGNVDSRARLITHFIDGINSTMRVKIYGLAAEPQLFSIDGDPLPDAKSNREHLTFNLAPPLADWT